MNTLSLLTEDRKRVLLESIQTVCQMFWGPDESRCKEMLKIGILREIEPLAPVLNVSPPDALEKVNTTITVFKDHQALFDYLETTYVRLFISNRKGGVVPLYQSCYEYENAPMMGAAAVMMKERLAAVGLSLGKHIHEPPDHLSVELEYLYFLLSKGWADDDASMITEAARFASTHMLPWVFQLHKRLMACPDSTFYSLVIALLGAVLQFIGD